MKGSYSIYEIDGVNVNGYE